METFIIGLFILLLGGSLYGSLCQKVFGPDDRRTPAYVKRDGFDFLPMSKWKNAMINLLNIAGTGPILGPIQGILFGPIAFISIPIGCVIGGAVHDYFSGMISLREGGIQMPKLIRQNMNIFIYRLYTVFVCIVLFLLSVVFIYTPGDIICTQIFGLSANTEKTARWIIYLIILLYYFIAVLFPIDKLIGKIYPVFGIALIFSAVGIFIMLFIKNYYLANIWDDWVLNGFDFRQYFLNGHFFPVFFITVACGIMSGFHSTQITIVSRTMNSEHDGRCVFYNMMIAEGFIAMVWAAGTMAMISLGAENLGITVKLIGNEFKYFAHVGGIIKQISPTSVVGVVCRNMLGNIGGLIAIIGIIILPITSGDTAIRSLRLIVSENLNIKNNDIKKQLSLAFIIFGFIFCILVWAKNSPNGFNVIWRYFGWSNQTLAVFALASIIIWLMNHGKKKFLWIPLIPFLFYSSVVCSYLCSAKIGLNLPHDIANVVGIILAILLAIVVVSRGYRKT